MSKQRHLLLIVGFLLMTAPAGVGQVNTAKPGEPVERHLSSDQTFREWSHDSNSTDETKLIKVCRVETVCKMRYREGQHAADARQEPRRATAVRGRDHSHFRCLHQTGPAGARQPAGQAGRDGPVHRLHGRRAADWPRREHLRKPLVVVEGKGAPRRIGHAGNPGIARVGDRKRRSRGLSPACLKRNGTGTER